MKTLSLLYQTEFNEVLFCYLIVEDRSDGKYFQLKYPNLKSR